MRRCFSVTIQPSENYTFTAENELKYKKFILSSNFPFRYYIGDGDFTSMYAVGPSNYTPLYFDLGSSDMTKNIVVRNATANAGQMHLTVEEYGTEQDGKWD